MCLSPDFKRDLPKDVFYTLAKIPFEDCLPWSLASTKEARQSISKAQTATLWLHEIVSKMAWLYYKSHLPSNSQEIVRLDDTERPACFSLLATSGTVIIINERQNTLLIIARLDARGLL